MSGITVLAGEGRSPILLKKWAALLLCLVLVWLFMFVLAPLMQKLHCIGAVAAHIEQTGIRASALYYTGVEETAEAEMYLRNAARYSPEG